MAQLDRSKPFARVRGTTGIRFEQDGHLFDAQGSELDVHGQPLKAGKAGTQSADSGDAKPKASAKPKAPAKPKASAKASAPEGVKPMSQQPDEGDE